MKYVFLVYQDEAIVAALEPCRRDAIAGEAAQTRKQLRQDGQLLMAAALLPAAGLTVRAPNGAVEIEDGPCAVTTEHLAAVWLIEARDLNEAIRLAARMPESCLGRIEVRPLEQEENG